MASPNRYHIETATLSPLTLHENQNHLPETPWSLEFGMLLKCKARMTSAAAIEALQKIKGTLSF